MRLTVGRWCELQHHSRGPTDRRHQRQRRRQLGPGLLQHVQHDRLAVRRLPGTTSTTASSSTMQRLLSRPHAAASTGSRRCSPASPALLSAALGAVNHQFSLLEPCPKVTQQRECIRLEGGFIVRSSLKSSALKRLLQLWRVCTDSLHVVAGSAELSARCRTASCHA